MLRLAWASLLARRVTAGLTVLSIALSVVLLLGVENVRKGAKESFASTISGTDLLVGARSGSVNLLLASIFHIGQTTGPISPESLEAIAARPEVDWIVPISLGDSHRGYRVVGTTPDYFARYSYGRSQNLAFTEGEAFADAHDAVIGAEVADRLGYATGAEIAIAHGLGAVSFSDHDERLTVTGILAPTGTPVDRTVLVDLDALALLHDEEETDHADEAAAGAEADHEEPVSALLVGLTSPVATLGLQRWIERYPDEALSAVLPGVALTELWSIVGVAERALLAISGLVALTAIIGLVAAILSGLDARRREMAVLRSVGAGPRHIAGLLVAEAGALTLLGALLGTVLVYAGLPLARVAIERTTGIAIAPSVPGPTEATLLSAVLLAGLLAGLVPAWRAYRFSLADGLAARV